MMRVSTAWLRVNAAATRVIDATWTMPGTGQSAHDEYAAAHIPGAVFFDIDAVADTTTTLPHMLPSPAKFAAHVGRVLGIRNDDHVVVYDNSPFASAFRA